MWKGSVRSQMLFLYKLNPLVIKTNINLVHLLHRNYTIDGVPYDGQVAGFVNLTPTPESGSYEECAAIILPSPVSLCL